jgi:hypothetical protein
MFRGALTAAAFAVCAVAGMTAAKADVIRVAIVTADSQGDYAANAALVPGFEALLKKGAGNKAVYAGTDPAKMSITTTSVFATAAQATDATSSPEWKAEAAKLKAKSYVIELFDLTP